MTGDEEKPPTASTECFTAIVSFSVVKYAGQWNEAV